MRFIKKILDRGNITIPSDVREALGVEEGDIVEFQILRVVKRTSQPTTPRSAPGEAPANTTSSLAATRGDA